ncbi:hypothetical protein [Brevundimonas vesicularis]|uniref:hypothetical protein n=1 Tax=Brevundimonas TaxID=41275 RepID=UPI000DDBBA9E|nr:hypothetical protein [Brevundimonas vesicularis]
MSRSSRTAAGRNTLTPYVFILRNEGHEEREVIFARDDDQARSFAEIIVLISKPAGDLEVRRLNGDPLPL